MLLAHSALQLQHFTVCDLQLCCEHRLLKHLEGSVDDDCCAVIRQKRRIAELACCEQSRGSNNLLK
jgi:hypothetical protein